MARSDDDLGATGVLVRSAVSMTSIDYAEEEYQKTVRGEISDCCNIPHGLCGGLEELTGEGQLGQHKQIEITKHTFPLLSHQKALGSAEIGSNLSHLWIELQCGDPHRVVA